MARVVRQVRMNCNLENGGSRIAWNDLLAPILFLSATERNHMKQMKERAATTRLCQEMTGSGMGYNSR